MNLKKFIIVNFISLMMTGVFISFNQNNSQLEPEAAVNETHRIWFSFGTLYTEGENNRSWAYADAHTYIYVWNTNGTPSPLAAWPGTKVVEGTSTLVNYDSNNSFWYFDVPQTYNRFKFARVNPSSSTDVWAQTNVDETLDANTKNYRFLLGPDSSVANENRQVLDFSATTTKIVSDFAATIDTSGEACSSSSAQTAIDTYNSMATFDQNQFDVLDVDSGAGVTTGLQRLQYLKDFYSIATILN